ncbi:TPA: SGNH/GDSL hydrolase family protein [Campylobacter coli]|nr:SGNH/GDSL hydrolase family protein [Campylobacter coli]
MLEGSTFLIQNGFSSVFDVNKFNLFNLSLGGTTSIQLLYELKKEKNYLLFKNADLIIVNSNVNEIQSCANKYENLSLELIYRDMELLFLELNKLNKKILVLILPFFYNDIVNKVNSIVRYLTKKYFFNLIDMQRYYEKHNLEDIAKAWDGSHQFNFITKKLAFEISNQIKNFRKPIQLNTYPEIDFKICYFDEYKKFTIQNSLMSEQYSRIKSGDKIKFEEMYYGYKILAIHTWNNTDDTDMNNMKKDWNMLTHTISPIVLQNKKIRISKPTNFMNMVVSIQNKIYIDKYTIIKYSNKDQFDEFYHNARTWESFNIAKHLDLISVFLIKGELVQDDLNNIYTNNSEISEYYNFSRLIPPVEWYKEIINEYCLVLDPRKKHLYIIRLQP